MLEAALVATVSVVAALTMVLLTAQSVGPELLLLRLRRRTLSTQYILPIIPLFIATAAICLAVVCQGLLASQYIETPTISIARFSQLDFTLMLLVFWQGLYLVVLAQFGQIALYSRSARVARAGARDFETPPPTWK